MVGKRALHATLLNATLEQSTRGDGELHYARQERTSVKARGLPRRSCSGALEPTDAIGMEDDDLRNNAMQEQGRAWCDEHCRQQRARLDACTWWFAALH